MATVECRYIKRNGAQCEARTRTDLKENSRCAAHKDRLSHVPCTEAGCGKFHQPRAENPYCTDHARKHGLFKKEEPETPEIAAAEEKLREARAQLKLLKVATRPGAAIAAPVEVKANPAPGVDQPEPEAPSPEPQAKPLIIIGSTDMVRVYESHEQYLASL